MKKHIVDVLEVESGFMALHGHEPGRNMPQALLLISEDGKEVPEVMTADKVGAVLEDVRKLLETGWVHPNEVNTIAAKYGITL